MKIAIVGPSRRFLSGIAYYTIRLANALSRDSTVSAILFRDMIPARMFPGYRRVGEDLTPLRFEERVEVHDILDWYNPFSWHRGAKIARSAEILILEWWTASVAHMQLAILLLLPHHIPAIIEYHEVLDPLEQSIPPIRLYSRIVGKMIRNMGAHFVVHSEADKKLITDSYGVPLNMITVIPHGLYDHYMNIEKEKARKRLGIGENHVILFFGLLRPYKGVRYLIEAFNDLPQELVSDARLFIAGETWEDKESREIANNSRFASKITFFDRYASDEEVACIFSAADILVLPYTRASQSGVAHIGMSYGLPIVASDVGGLRESLSQYEGTIFVPPANTDALGRAMIRAISERKKYMPPAHLEWSSIADRWRALFSELVNAQ